TREEADARACEARKRLKGGCVATHMYDDEAEEENLWQVREAGLGATAYLPGGADHYEGWEDSAVPPEKLGSYLRGFQELLDRHEYDTSLYGPELVAAFGEFRRIWDPEGALNPRKVIEPFEPTENLKLGTDYNPPKLAT